MSQIRLDQSAGFEGGLFTFVFLKATEDYTETNIRYQKQELSLGVT